MARLFDEPVTARAALRGLAIRAAIFSLSNCGGNDGAKHPVDDQHKPES
jgi:hypothetical protein